MGENAIREYQAATTEVPQVTVIVMPVRGLLPKDGPFSTNAQIRDLKATIIESGVKNGVREVVFVADYTKHMPDRKDYYKAQLFSPAKWKKLCSQSGTGFSLVTVPPPKLRNILVSGAGDVDRRIAYRERLPAGLGLTADDSKNKSSIA